MSRFPHESPDVGRAQAGLREFGCLPSAAVFPGVTLLCMFVLGWMGVGSAAVAVGVIGAIAAVPAGYFAGSVLRKAWGVPPAAWIALGLVSWLVLVAVLVVVLVLRR